MGAHVRYALVYKSIRIILILLLAILLIWPFLEARQLQVEQTTITSPSLPSSVGQLRVVYLSDIHATGFPFFSSGQVNDLARKINALNPDIVLLGGDYAENTESTIDFFLNLPDIHSNYGVYAVLGEHDRTNTDSAVVSRLRAAMISAGVTPLINSVDNVRIGRTDIYLAGLDDAGHDLASIPAVTSAVHQEDFVILMSHNPSVTTDVLTSTDANGHINWFDLGLFGRTHNGQMVDVFSAVGLSAKGRRGWFTENRIPMLVSNGVGTTGLPMRFLCPPTIHVITIKAGS